MTRIVKNNINETLMARLQCMRDIAGQMSDQIDVLENSNTLCNTSSSSSSSEPLPPQLITVRHSTGDVEMTLCNNCSEIGLPGLDQGQYCYKQTSQGSTALELYWENGAWVMCNLGIYLPAIGTMNGPINDPRGDYAAIQPENDFSVI